MRRLCQAGLVALFTCAAGFPAELTASQWRQDLQVLATELPRLHKNLFFQQPKAEFERKVRELDTGIPTMSEMEIRAALVRLVAGVGNAHTTINALQGTPVFPLAVRFFAEGVYVTAAAPDRGDLLGARVVAVNGMAVEEVRRRLLPYFAKENDVAELVSLPPLMRNAAVLQAAGVIQGMDRAEFTLERNGVESKVPLDAGQGTVLESGVGGPKIRPINYWFEYMPDAQTMYVQYNACQQMKELPFAEFTAEVMKAAAAKPVRRFVVDLRFNGGGDSEVVQPLVRALKSQSKAKVFVLVGRKTFSSGFMAAEDFQSKCHGILVGEAMGQRPNTYGDIRPLKLPNSGLTAWYCTKYFHMAKEDVPQVEPDVKVAYKPAEYFSQRDSMLEYALTH